MTGLVLLFIAAVGVTLLFAGCIKVSGDADEMADKLWEDDKWL